MLRRLLVSMLLGALTMAGLDTVVTQTQVGNLISGPYGNWNDPLAHVKGGRQPYQPPQYVTDFAQNPQRTFWEVPNMGGDNGRSAWQQSEEDRMRNVDWQRAAFNTQEASYAAGLASGGLENNLDRLSKALDTWNGLLPYRKSIMHNPEQRKAQDLLISRFVHDPRVMFTYIDANGHAYEMDASTRYLLAASLLDLMHNRWDTLEKQLLALNPPLQIIQIQDLSRYYEQISSEKTGFYTGRNDDILLDSGYIWRLVANSSRLDIVNHEAAHGLDAQHWSLIPFTLHSACLNGLSPEDCQIKDAEFDRLRGKLLGKIEKLNLQNFELNVRPHLEASLNAPPFASNQPVPEIIAQRRAAYLQDHRYNPNVVSVDGISSYAFSLDSSWNKIPGVQNRAEFLPVLIQLFQTSPSELQKASPKMYDMLSRYFKLDPIKNWRDLP